MVSQPGRRFAIQTALVGRIYAGYKLLQLKGRMGLDSSDASWQARHRTSAQAIYDMATRLEGLPIKVCQFLGSRADILPDEYVARLSLLQDRVPPRTLDSLLPLLRSELGRPLEAAFASFEPTPVASASLAQVHRARLHDGRTVAVKIQYPEIAGLVASDLRNFAFLVRVLANLERNLDLTVLVREISTLVPLELDFVNEARNGERMAEFLRSRDDVFVPAVVRELSSRRVLVTEFAEGVRCTDVDGLRRQGVDPREVAHKLSDVFAEMILRHGFFHGDPHPGNILVQPGPRLVLLDFGLAKDFPPGFREGVMRVTSAIVGGDKAEIASAFRAIGFRTRHDSDESLAMIGEMFLGYALRTGKAYADGEMIKHFNSHLPAAMKSNPLTEVPSDILLVGRVMGLLSGIGKQLGSEVDPGAVMMPYLSEASG